MLLALTREENTNLMVVQIARVAFRIPRVIAMVYDPQRDENFCSMGIDTLKITVTGAELLASQIDGIGERHDAELVALHSDDADFPCADFAVDPDEGGR